LVANHGVAPADPSDADSVADDAELRALVERLTARLDAVQAENAKLQAQGAESKQRLGHNSQNSSTPPSADLPFTKPAPRSLRRKGEGSGSEKDVVFISYRQSRLTPPLDTQPLSHCYHSSLQPHAFTNRL